MISRTQIKEEFPYKRAKNKCYWCYKCQREFSKLNILSQELECPFCHNYVIEELNNDSGRRTIRPQDYIPYFSYADNQLVEERVFRISRNNSYIGQIIEELIQLEYNTHEIELILAYIIQNEQQESTNHPTSQKSISQLESHKINKERIESYGIENACCICKDEFTINQIELILPCKHYFHKECIIHWLKEHNSCPVCRFELPSEEDEVINTEEIVDE